MLRRSPTQLCFERTPVCCREPTRSLSLSLAQVRVDAAAAAVSATGSNPESAAAALAALRGGELYDRQIALNESLAATVASTSGEFANTLDKAYHARMRWRHNTVSSQLDSR